MSDRLRFGPFLLLDQATRERLASLSTPRTLKPEETLIEEREPTDDAFVVLDGSVRVLARGERRTLAIVGAPAMVGEMAVVNDQMRSASVVADTPCTVLRIPGKELRKLMAGNALFATAMHERTDLLVADAFLKRKSPVRDLPAEIVGVLASRLRPRELAPDQLIEGNDDDLYLVRRGAVENMGDGSRTPPGEFVQRQRGERYAAAGETWLYELRMADVAMEIIRHQERVRGFAARLGDDAKVRMRERVISVRVPDLGGALVHDTTARAVVSEHVGALIARIDGTNDVASLVRESGRTRGEIVEGLAMLVAAGLADIAD